MSAKELLESQALLGQQLTKLFINFSKANQAQKSKLSYVSSKIQEAKDLFNEFNENHIKLMFGEDKFPDDPYFVKNYFIEIKAIYDKQFDVLLDQQLGLIGNAAQAGSADNATISVTDQNILSLVKLQRTQIKVLNSTMSAPMLLTTFNAMELFYTDLQAKANKITQDQEKLYSCVDEIENIPADLSIEKFQEIKAKVFNFMGKLKQQMNELQPTASDTIEHEKMNLPNIKIPEFDGDFKKWPTFKSLFEEIVHNRDIHDIRKLVYLQQSLTGDAATIFGQLEQGQNNYKGAWERVKETYDNKRKLVFSIADRFFSQPNIKDETASSLKLLFNVTKECIVSFKSVNISFDSCEPLIVYLLLKKLDQKSRESFEDFIKSPRDPPTMENFLQFVEHRFQALENLNKKGYVHKQLQWSERHSEVGQGASGTHKPNISQPKYCFFL